jgi:hypothetical protein
MERCPFCKIRSLSYENVSYAIGDTVISSVSLKISKCGEILFDSERLIIDWSNLNV